MRPVRPFRNFIGGSVLPLAVLLVCLGLTHLAWRKARQEMLREARAYFEVRVDDAQARIERRMATYEQVLWAVQGRCEAGPTDREDFRRFVGAMRVESHLAGFQAIGFQPVVRRADKARFEAGVRREGFPDFAIRPAGDRDPYTSVLYVEPFTGRNLRALGYDGYAEPVRHLAMESSRQLNDVVMTGKVVLVQEDGTDNQAGAILFLPVYAPGTDRTRARAWVYAAFRMNELTTGIFGSAWDDLDLAIYDGPTPSPGAFMCATRSGKTPPTYQPDRIKASRQLTLGHHTWTLSVQALPGFEERMDGGRSRTVLAAGILVSLLITLLVWLLAHSRDRAMAWAELQETRFKALMQQADDGILLVDEQGTIQEVNDRALEYFERPVEEVKGSSLASLHEPEGAARIRTLLLRLHRQDSDRIDLVRPRSDGSRMAVEVGARAVTIGGRRWFVCIIHDVTRRLKAEEDLRQSETQTRALLNAIPDLIFITDREGVFRGYQASDPTALFQSPEAFLGRSCLDILPQPLADRVMEAIAHTLTSHTVQLLTYSLPVEGVERHFEARVLPYTGETTLIIVRDITEQKRAEEERRRLQAQLAQTQKLESLGSLAGGVAHDMNNVLAAIQAVTQTLKLVHGGDESLTKAMDIIETAATRGRDLVKGLTNFVRKDIREAELLDLNTLVRDEMAILQRTTEHKVALVLDLAGDLPAVYGEKGILGSALMNLCVNALDAMPGGGTLTLRTRILEPGEVGLEVADTGVGMTPEVLSRAMDPFFTTKPVGKGTGLGLSSVYAAAKAHGGSVSLRSEPGQGTTVLLRLPSRPEAAAPREAAGFTPPAVRPLEILLVDDDELIRASVPDLVALYGHTVTSVAGGEEALAWLGGPHKADLVILDLNMPGMNGLETFREMRRRGLELPVLLATGHLDLEAANLLEGGGRALAIAKPFTLEDLGRKIQELLAY